jgi:hypothetical protein
MAEPQSEHFKVDLAGRLRRLPERWVLAVATRRPMALLLSFLVVGAACWGFSAIADANAAHGMAGIFMSFVVFSGLGQWRFRRQLRALDQERSEVVVGPSRVAPSIDATKTNVTARPGRKKPSRNPRSAAFLTMGGPSGHLAQAITAVLMWGVLILLIGRSSHIDWFGQLGLAPEILGVTLAAALAFEQVGYHQASSRRADEIARLRREIARASSPLARPSA